MSSFKFARSCTDLCTRCEVDEFVYMHVKFHKSANLRFQRKKHTNLSKRNFSEFVDALFGADKRLSCVECGRHYNNLRSLQRHKQSVHTDTPERFDSPRCSKRFRSKASYSTHMKLEHDIGLQSEFCCDESGCSAVFALKSDLKRHNLVHRKASMHATEDESNQSVPRKLKFATV